MQNLHATDRENAGLRGPVSVNIEERVFCDDRKDVTTTKYSPDGKLLTPKASFTNVVSWANFASELSSGSLWDSMALGRGLSKGESVTTLYDENHRATELQIHIADGTIVSRIVRTYDTNGRVTEEKMIWENMAAYILDKQVDRDKMNPERLNRFIAAESVMLRGKSQVGVFYAFDEQNRLVETVERDIHIEKTRTITYNDQGDKAEERLTFADNAAFPEWVSHRPTSVPEDYSVRYVYQYDSFGNWIQRIRTVSKESQPEESSVRNRKLSYYHPQ